MRLDVVLRPLRRVNVLRLSLIAILVVVLGIASLYAYRAQSPGDIQLVAILLTVLPLLLASSLILLGVSAFSGGARKSASLRRVDALAKLTDLRDRDALSADEFEREKKRLLA